jgi:sodium/potassium-transporting ATPase subunit alpha
MQIVAVFLCRSSVRSVFAMPFGNNRWILFGVALELVLLFVYNNVPLANWLLNTTAVPPWLWLTIIPMGVFTLGLEEVRKTLLRRWLRRQKMSVHAAA